MDVSTLLNNRISCPRVEGGAPDDSQIQQLLEAAVSAPDHGRLRPWRFLVLKGEKLQKLGDIFTNAKLASQPDLPDSALERVRSKPLRAPLVIVVVAEVTEDHKVPVAEQKYSTACAVEHMMLAGYAMGLGMMWRTGEMATNARVKEALGFTDKDEIISFLYVGAPARELPARDKVEVASCLRELPGS